jgi:CRP-like cAMP-binding protein
MDPNPLIRKFEGYAPLSHEDGATIRALCEEQVATVPAKRDIIKDGESPDYIHLILDGWAARYKQLPDGSRQITAFLIPGDFCDLHATVLATMDHGIVALTACKVAYLDSAKLDQITTERSMLTKALWWMTLVDEATLREWVINSRRRAPAAVAHLLCEMHLRLRLVGLANDNSLELPLTQDDLADATGMTSVHMNRTIQTLRESGLIQLKAGRLDIPDMQELASAGGFDDRYLHLRNQLPRRVE